ASQLTALSKSALYMRIGNIDFEMSWMEKIMDMNRSMKLADLSSGIDPVSMEAGDHEHVHGHVDPHIWMSARNAVIIAGNVYRELVPLLPGKEKELEVRYDSLLTRLDSLETAMEIMLEGLEGRGFMIYHPALTYFARDYGLEQYPVELEGKTPSPAYMRRLTDLAREKNIRSIFLQMQFDQDNARVLSRETGADIIQINPLDPDWYGQMLYIAGKMAWTLQKESQQD
ncbi:MAG: zinc ABC transporter substrate-binding protein, partial [Bacteroidetes bacterium]